MKTTTNKKEKEVRKESVLEELFVLWSKTSKNGLDYLSGQTTDKHQLVGYYNSTKKNPKEPDIRVYLLDEDNKQDHEVCSLWTTESKNGTEYFSGTTDEKEKVVAFYGDKENPKRPIIKVYVEK